MQAPNFQCPILSHAHCAGNHFSCVQFSHAVMNLAPAMTSGLDDAESKRDLEHVADAGDLLEIF